MYVYIYIFFFSPMHTVPIFIGSTPKVELTAVLCPPHGIGG